MFIEDNECLFPGYTLHTDDWSRSCTYSECTLHQLSPYIGKLKSSIAHDLIGAFSCPGDWVVDPFAGSGTIPLEALLLGRRVLAADISSYSRILTIAKLNAPKNSEDAIIRAKEIFLLSEKLAKPDPETVPGWVKDFFHPQTLQEAIKFASVARQQGNEFWMACFLGILHHERPGFLSYPASHLVPYLRTRKYPEKKFPGMYGYKELFPRLLAKIKRVYKRVPVVLGNLPRLFHPVDIESLQLPDGFDCLITSPPYMKTLDYVRDNRLRLWFVNPDDGTRLSDSPVIRQRKAFENAMVVLAKKTDKHIKRGGYAVLIVGERLGKGKRIELSEMICQIMAKNAPGLTLLEVVNDNIPDIRRSRRNCQGTKAESILIFRRK